MNNRIKMNLNKAAPTVLSVIASASVIGITVLTALKTKEAVLKVNEIEKKRGEKLTKKEVVKTVAPVYIPVVALDVATITCILGANSLNRQQQASLISAYALTERAYSRYKEKVVETYGEDAHKKIMDELAVTEAKKTYISGQNFTTICSLDFDDENEEKHLFYDKFSMRYFTTTFSQVLQAEYHLNRNFVVGWGENYVNEFYEFLGLEPIKELGSYGWFVMDEFYWVDFNHVKTVMDDGLEVWIIEMSTDPMEYQAWTEMYDGCY